MEESPEARTARYICRESTMRGEPFAHAQLPDTAILETVRLTRRDLARFRERYAALMEFAAAVCGTTVKELFDDHLTRKLDACPLRWRCRKCGSKA